MTGGRGLRDLKTAEVVMLAIGYTVVGFSIPRELATDVGDGTSSFLSPAARFRSGWWYALVSIPTFQLLTYRWLWRIIIWTRFLWRMSRLDLQLVPGTPTLPAV